VEWSIQQSAKLASTTSRTLCKPSHIANPWFAKNYGGEAGVTFVRDSIGVYAERSEIAPFALKTIGQY
jgi:hypothetical protein